VTWFLLIAATLIGALVLGVIVAAGRHAENEPIERTSSREIVAITASPHRQSSSSVRGRASQGKRNTGTKQSRRRPLTKKGALRQLESFGIKERDFDRKAAELSKRFGAEAAPVDVAWGLYQDIIAGKHGEGESLNPSLYYSMALFLDREGRSGFEQLQSAARMQIRRFQETGVVKKLRIRTAPGACEACRRQDGKMLTFTQALKQMPIPCKNCTGHMQDEKLSFCRCIYEAVLD
jgi:hypothetical protein